MNALLIHNDNLPTALISNFKNTLKFNIGYAQTLEFDFTFDKEAHNQLNDALGNKSFDTIFIPYSLSVNNYLELSGLRLALHIRLTNEFGHKNTPIVFLGHETKEQITKISDYGSFLFSPGIFNTSKFEYHHLEEQHNWVINNWKENSESLLNKREYDLFLSRTTIKPATSHLSNHSLVNEWAIYQWAKLINSEDNNCFHQIFSKIDTDLYFNYLKALHPISRQNVIDRKDLEIRFSGEAPKVLLIDDESDKGWADLFVDIFEEFYFYDIPSYDFKNKSLNELLKFCLNNIEELKIDLVILDFRLLPQDHIVNKLEEISSIKLLKAIKLYNPGIQVVVFSATDKVWNLNALQRAGADGFVNKGASIELQNKYSVKKSIESLVEQVQESMSLRYLKTIFTLLYKIKNNINSCEYEDDSSFHGFIIELKEHVGLIEELGRNLGKSPKSTDFMFLACFHFLEKFKNQYFIQDRRKQVFIGLERVDCKMYRLSGDTITKSGKLIDQHNSWFNAIVNLLVDYFEVLPTTHSEFRIIDKLAKLRNNYIHEDMQSIESENIVHIVELMDLVTTKMKE